MTRKPRVLLCLAGGAMADDQWVVWRDPMVANVIGFILSLALAMAFIIEPDVSIIVYTEKMKERSRVGEGLSEFAFYSKELPRP